MDLDQIAGLLALSLEDHRLTRSERQEIATPLQELDESERLTVGRLAFTMVERQLNDDEDAMNLLRWLERIMSALIQRQADTSGYVQPPEAFFSPEDDCADHISQLIDNTLKSVDICVFTITDDRISNAVIDAHRRGVKVRIITDDDKAQDLGSDIDRFRKVRIPLRTDRSEYHMHHKFAIFDGRRILSGSYNWTRGASLNNQENIVLSSDPGLVRAFTRTFEKLWKRLS